MSSQVPGDAGLPEDAPLAAVTRGALVESVHRGRLVVCDPDGNVLEAVGDPEAYVYARSSTKPFQALPLVLSGAADAFGLTDRELAVACASHNAEEPHLAAVRSILQKAGLTEDDLQSGAHLPLHEPEADALIRSGEEPRPIHSNCSGKHAGMLAVCAYEGYETATYRDPAHPRSNAAYSVSSPRSAACRRTRCSSPATTAACPLSPCRCGASRQASPALPRATPSPMNSPLRPCAYGTRCGRSPLWSLAREGSTRTSWSRRTSS